MQLDTPVTIRDATPADLDALARLWADVWRTSHAHLLPEPLVRLRTPESFRDRMQAAIEDGRVRVAGHEGAPLGFAIVKGDELDQLYVAPAAHGTGLAALLLDDAERRLRVAGVATAWLACAIGNDRAARFYEKRGWRRVGTFMHQAETSEGRMPIETWRYEKRLVVG